MLVQPSLSCSLLSYAVRIDLWLVRNIEHEFFYELLSSQTKTRTHLGRSERLRPCRYSTLLKRAFPFFSQLRVQRCSDHKLLIAGRVRRRADGNRAVSVEGHDTFRPLSQSGVPWSNRGVRKSITGAPRYLRSLPVQAK